MAHRHVCRPAHIQAHGEATVAWSLATTSRDATTVTTCRPRAPRRLTRQPCPLQHSIKEARRCFLPHDAKSHLKPSWPPLEADRMPQAVCFLNRMGLATVSHLWAPSEPVVTGVSFTSAPRCSPATSSASSTRYLTYRR
jgi:hypothetical protein